MLRDRLVCGIAHPQWQKRLLSDSLTFEKAVKMLQSMESAEHEVKGFGGQPSKQPQSMHRVTRGIPGKTGHHQVNWRAAQTTAVIAAKAIILQLHILWKKLFAIFATRKGTLLPHARLSWRGKARVDQHKLIKSLRLRQHWSHRTTLPLRSACCIMFTQKELHRSPSTSTSTIHLFTWKWTPAPHYREEVYQSLWPPGKVPALQETGTKLKSYTGDAINVKGTIDVDDAYQNEKAKLPLIVFAGSGPSLLGRNWICQFHLDWSQLHHIGTEPHEPELKNVIDRHHNLFKSELGQVTSVAAKIYISEDAQPRFLNARKVPYALQEKVGDESNHLVKEGVLEPVYSSLNGLLL